MTGEGMNKIALLLLLLLGGCALAPTTVSGPGKTAGIFYPNVVITHYNPVVYPARRTPPPGGEGDFFDFHFME